MEQVSLLATRKGDVPANYEVKRAKAWTLRWRPTDYGTFRYFSYQFPQKALYFAIFFGKFNLNASSKCLSIKNEVLKLFDQILLTVILT